jgi:CRISPR/Cas system CSM-associated protein Csm3 (group 7 of RAMP superfamily)
MTPNTVTYSIRFHSDWHIGSGLSGGAESNSVVLKDGNDLPRIPGKTLKGLIREAAVTLNRLDHTLVSDEFVTTVFGEGEDKLSPEEMTSGLKVHHAITFFSDAEMSGTVRQQVSPLMAEALYRKITSTAIDNDGLAKDHSLRTKEVTAPLTLFAQVRNFPSTYQDQLTHCLKAVKRMGGHRYRGLGRCSLTIVNTTTDD